MNIHTPSELWKTPVEKTVENVENYELSTGISPLSNFPPSCGKVCIPRCIFGLTVSENACYVTGSLSRLPAKTSAKSLQIVKSRCHFLFPFHVGLKFFVKNAKKSLPVSSASSGEYLNQAAADHHRRCLSINNIRGYTCREK